LTKSFLRFLNTVTSNGCSKLSCWIESSGHDGIYEARKTHFETGKVLSYHQIIFASPVAGPSLKSDLTASFSWCKRKDL
jgi:hypothetical protein